MNKILTGALAGFVATLPMTWWMKFAHERLPEEERYPLPPREITMQVAEEVGIKKHLDEPQREGLTLAAHFSYGAAAGALYAPLSQSVSAPPLIKGASFGLAVWAGSYLGLMPALGILRPATKHPARRTALMIGAHVVWGSVAGLVVKALDEEK